jgi:uncharacterized protein (DUF2141 family)
MATRILMLFAVLGVAASGSAVPQRAGTAGPQKTGTAVLTVKVIGFRNAKGRLDALLFSGPKGFPDEDSRAVDDDEVSIDPKTLTAEVVFRNLPPGTYAVTVLHDENMNRKMDSNFFGIPKEGYGSSMNPPKMHRAPKFDEAKFSLSPEGRLIQVKLIYY